jgi:hypothetical protein
MPLFFVIFNLATLAALGLLALILRIDEIFLSRIEVPRVVARRRLVRT